MNILEGAKEEEGAAGCEVSSSTKKHNISTWRRAESCCRLCRQYSASKLPLLL